MSANPIRGCGTKKHDAFYLESDMSKDGPLHAWTWVLGDGLDHVIPIAVNQVPRRIPVLFNPAATLVKETFVGSDVVQFSPIEKDAYEYFLTKTKGIGVADYVGSNNYTAASFAAETARYGPSRRIPRTSAAMFLEIFQDIGPFPMWFVHADIPMYQNITQAAVVNGYAKDALSAISDYLDFDAQWFKPVWRYDSWGQYAIKNQDAGHDHYLVPILKAIDVIERNDPLDRALLDSANIEWEWLRDEFTNRFVAAHFEPQFFGASWMTKVTYTLPEEDKEKAAEKIRQEMPGINILDLEEQVD